MNCLSKRCCVVIAVDWCPAFRRSSRNTRHINGIGTMVQFVMSTSIGFNPNGSSSAALRDLREAYMHLNRTLRNIRQARQCVVSWDFKKIDKILELAESNGKRAREALGSAGKRQAT